MATDKPLISILMAVYDPRMDWLEEQLNSLNEQSYPNLRLYVRDDCSPHIPYDEIQTMVAKCITKFPYSIQRNEINTGSNIVFERLTAEAEGTYFAYCDQDDIWCPEKLEILQRELEHQQAGLICSDMTIIDAEGNQTAASITEIRRHHTFRSGDDLAPDLMISNFVTGCTMLIRSELAKAAIPFCPYMVHDQYLSFHTALDHRIVSLPDHLIHYRVHGNNQTGLMSGVTDKQSYLEQRIDSVVLRTGWLAEHFGEDQRNGEEFRAARVWAKARQDNFHKHFKAKKLIYQYRRFSPLVSLFEIVMSGAPEHLFMFIIRLNQRNII